MRWTFAFSLALTWSICAPFASAQIDKQTIPGRWLDPYLPEDLPPLDYPGYGLVSLNTGYSWKRGVRQFYVGLSLRNVLDRDLLASNARVGGGRELGFSARMNF